MYDYENDPLDYEDFDPAELDVFDEDEPMSVLDLFAMLQSVTLH